MGATIASFSEGIPSAAISSRVCWPKNCTLVTFSKAAIRSTPIAEKPGAMMNGGQS